ncbi:MAG: neutral zinc metallopeptidase, partial [Burkholderiales bacterium]
MRWEDGRQSGNVEDRRGMRMPGGRAGGLGLGTIVVALLGSWLFGINPMVTIGLMQGAGQLAGGGAPTQVEGRRGPVQDEAGRFTSVVVASTQDGWTALFRPAGAPYPAPQQVVLEGATPPPSGPRQP